MRTAAAAPGPVTLGCAGQWPHLLLVTRGLDPGGRDTPYQFLVTLTAATYLVQGVSQHTYATLVSQAGAWIPDRKQTRYCCCCYIPNV